MNEGEFGFEKCQSTMFSLSTVNKNEKTAFYISYCYFHNLSLNIQPAYTERLLRAELKILLSCKPKNFCAVQFLDGF